MNDKSGRDALESKTQGIYYQRNIIGISVYIDGRALDRPPDNRVGAATSDRESLPVPDIGHP